MAKTDCSHFDNRGDQRLQEIKNMNGSTPLSDFQYTYNPVGTIATWQQQTDSNTPTQYALGYDAADQLTSAVQTTTGTGAAVSSNHYAYDPAGNRLAETTPSAVMAGQFNALNQLTSYSNVSGTQTVAGYTSAAVTGVTVNAVPASLSNSTNFSASVPLPAGTNTVSVVAKPASGSATTQRYQIVTSGTAGTSLSYDADGNTLTDENGNSYQWDALNRLTKITYPSGAYTLFAYDGLSRRTQIVEENASNTVTSTKNYLWIGQEMAEERDASNQVTKRFFPQGEQQSETSYYYTRDHLGSMREMVTSAGTMVTRYDYDPYGKVTLVSGTNLATKQYAGYYNHQKSELSLAQYRTLDLNSGRWLSRDPWGANGGINIYGYVVNNPIGWNDPRGLAGVRTPAMLVTPGEASPWSQTVDILVINCPCHNIKFIQSLSNGFGAHIDDDYSPDPPYYNNQGVPNGMEDRPGPHDVDTNEPSNAFTRWLYSKWFFETCAYCLDGGTPKVIGCRKWSIVYDSSGKAKLSGMTGPTGTAMEPPSPDFEMTRTMYMIFGQ